MAARGALVGWLVVILGLPGAIAHAATGRAAAAVGVPLPSAGNVSVARLALQGPATGSAAPRLTLASHRGLPARTLVVESVVPGSAPGRFLATVAIVRPSATTAPAPAARTAARLSLGLPAGFRLASPALAAKDVLYQNTPPPFTLVRGGQASLLAGENPKLPPARVVQDAQLLALDRTVPLADMGLLRLQYVTAQFGPRGARMRVTIGLSQLTQVNAVELVFAAGTKVAIAAKPAGTDGIPAGTGIQLIASGGFFQAGLPYAFTLTLSRPPRRGEGVTVRASTHYFESALPFVERFVLG